MNYEKAMAWADALDSGDYEQVAGTLTRSRLFGVKAHCCLGVQCVLAIKNDVPLIVDRTSLDSNRVSYDGNVSHLPHKVREWGDFKARDPQFTVPMAEGFDIWDDADERVEEYEHAEYYMLSELNDSGFTFSQIADLIRRFWEEL